MCGIAGGHWLQCTKASELQMNSALHALRYRGPDHREFEMLKAQEGSVILGHSRLSVIDLSNSANQPMHSLDGRLAIVFNGEIYNYIELRDELEGLGIVFRTSSDTEVLLAAWSIWGVDSLKRLVGMFAFVIIDQESQTLIAARDGFGIKPFYYTQESGGFRFASELPALRALCSGKPLLNWQRAYDYLVHGEYDSGQETFFADVYALLPGHLLIQELRKGAEPRIEKWWSPNIEEVGEISFEEAVLQFRKMFLGSVQLHLRSDVPLGAALSGGLDSSAIVCAMRYLEPSADIHTFSFIASNADVSEENWVDRVNGHVGAIEHKISVSPADLANDLEDLVLTQGEPFGSTSIYAQYRVFKLAKQCGMTVTLDGQGADELLGGYNGYPGQRIRSMIERNHPIDAWRFLDAWSKWPGRSRWEGMKRVVGAYSSGRLYQTLRQLNGMANKPEWLRIGPLREAGVLLMFPGSASTYDVPGRRLVGSLAGTLCGGGLSALLRHGDRNSMRFSIESRVPFLTTQLADFTMGLPEEYLVSAQGESKRLLRAAMRGIVPDDVLDRRDKVGFATPERSWLFGISGVVRQWLLDDLGLPFLDQRKVLEAFDRIVSGKSPFTWQVWRWINFCCWYRANFTK